MDLTTIGFSALIVGVIAGATALIHFRLASSHARYESTATIGALALLFALYLTEDEIGAALSLALVITIWSAALLSDLATRPYRPVLFERCATEPIRTMTAVPSALVTIDSGGPRPRPELLRNLMSDSFDIRVRSRSDRIW